MPGAFAGSASETFSDALVQTFTATGFPTEIVRPLIWSPTMPSEVASSRVPVAEGKSVVPPTMLMFPAYAVLTRFGAETLNWVLNDARSASASRLHGWKYAEVLLLPVKLFCAPSHAERIGRVAPFGMVADRRWVTLPPKDETVAPESGEKVLK